MDEPKNVERKFWGPAAKHFSLGGSVVMLVFVLKPYFFTRDEGVAQTAQIEELKTIVKEGFAHQESMLFAHANDEIRKHERMVDDFHAELKDDKTDWRREIDHISQMENIKRMRTQSN